MTALEGAGSKIIYRAATGLEKAMADVDAIRLIAVEVERIIDVWNPYRISFENLPYLSWALGVNLWDDDWLETTKRSWTARQWEFKSLRGTEGGVRMAIDYVGRDVSPWGYSVVKFTTPPQAVYSGPSLTRAEREAWLATLPQLRVWRTYERGIAEDKKAFYGGRGPTRRRNWRFCLGGMVISVHDFAVGRPGVGEPLVFISTFWTGGELAAGAPVLGAPPLASYWFARGFTTARPTLGQPTLEVISEPGAQPLFQSGLFQPDLFQT